MSKFLFRVTFYYEHPHTSELKTTYGDYESNNNPPTKKEIEKWEEEMNAETAEQIYGIKEIPYFFAKSWDLFG